jgi:hypothetical protein
MIETSTPNILDFVPLPSQLKVIQDVRSNFDYSIGTHELLLSGSVGSAKSLTLAHVVVTHCLMFPGARVGVGRLALPQLKATLCQKIKEHLYDTGIDYRYHESTGNFDMPAGASIKAISWADGNLAKLGSMEFSAFAIEELTETKDPRPYDVILQRVNRLPHIREPWVLSGTNPDSPSHFAYRKIIQSKSPKVHVYYSNTFDNPYLPRAYIDGLAERLDPKMARRMLYGEWIEIDRERVYYSYDKARNKKEHSYVVQTHLPIRLTYDFNIGDGKPLSLVLSQYDPMTDTWHFYNEVIVDGQRTLDSLEEAEARGIIPISQRYIIHGDCNGRSRDTRQTKTDYELIENWLAKKNYRFEIQVPKSNPPVRDRHNVVNGYMLNAKGESKLFVYRDAPTVDEGFMLTRLRPGGQYLEVDTDRWQHCTTACGYAIMFEAQMRNYYSKQTYRQVGTY